MSLPVIQNVLFISLMSLFMAYDVYLSSWSILVLAIIIWSLVLHFIIFRVSLTIVKAVIIILKHATLLRLSNLSPQSALTHANLDYLAADIDLKIEQHLTASLEVHTIEEFAGFLMDTDIGWFFLAFVKIMSHQAFSAISVFSRNTCACKWSLV